jgi:hypothetical protein
MTEQGGGSISATSYTGYNTSDPFDFVAGDIFVTLRPVDLDDIPAGSTINSVELFVYSDTAYGSNTVTIYECLRAWVSGQVTGNSYSTGNNWAAVGGTGSGDRSASSIGTINVVSSDDGVYVSTTIAASIVQDWLDNATARNGFLLNGSSYGAFGGGANANPPFLRVDYTSGGAPTHETSGALAGQAATVAGAADRTHLHGTSGALAAQAASVAGAADRTHLHGASGSLQAQAAAVTGAAARTRLHGTSGALAAQAAELTGAAERARVHGTTGVLGAQAATLAGAAERAHFHDASGALAAQSATVAGSADHTSDAHDTSGSLQAQAAAMAGTADRTHLHGASGSLAAQAASVTGAAARTLVHDTSGLLAAQAASVTGAADHIAAGTHTSVGGLAASAATVTGQAALSPQNSLLDAKYQGRRKNVPFKPLKTAPEPVFVPNVIDPPIERRAVTSHIDLDLLPEPAPAPAPASAPVPKKVRPAPKAPPVSELTPEPAPPPPPAPEPAPAPPPLPAAATQEQVAGLVEAVAEVTALAKGLTEVNTRLAKQMEVLAKDLAEANKTVAALREDARIRDQKEQNRRRAEAIAEKLLRD